MNTDQFNELVPLAMEAYRAKYISDEAQSHARATARATGRVLDDSALSRAHEGLSQTLRRVEKEALEAKLREEEAFELFRTSIMKIAERDEVDNVFHSTSKITSHRVDELEWGEVPNTEVFAIHFFQENFISTLNKTLETNFIFSPPILSSAVASGFFSTNKPEDTVDEQQIEQSSLSIQQIEAIRTVIKQLNREIDSFWPYPNKDRKAKKVLGLKALIENALTMDAVSAVEKVESDYPAIRVGIYSRTAELLDSIRGFVTKENQELI